MKRDSIAFRIDNYRAESVLADLLPFPQNFAAVFSRGFDGFIEPALHQEIDQRAVGRRTIVDASAIATQTKASGRILLFVWQQTVFGFAVGDFADLACENGGVELNRPVEVRDWDICPAESVSCHFDIVIPNFLRSLH